MVAWSACDQDVLGSLPVTSNLFRDQASLMSVRPAKELQWEKALAGLLGLK